jgi:signal transduction histidine kinase
VTGRHSVRVRLTVAATLLVGVVSAAVAVAFVRQVERSLVGDVEERTAAVLADVTDALAAGADPRDVLVPITPWEAGIAGMPSGPAFVVSAGFGGPGTVLVFEGEAGDDLLERFAQPLPPPAGEAQATAQVLEARRRAAAGDLAIASVPGAEDGAVLAASPLDDVHNSVDALRAGLWIAVPCLTLAMGLIAWFVAGRALRPVEAIARRADEITSSNLHERVPEPGTGDEVAHLAATVNAMLGRLEQGADRQRRFVSDASHELRSPVAAIRTQVEVGLREAGTDWDDVGRTVLAESTRLEHLVDDLLTLARTTERGADTSTGAPSDLRDVVTTEAARHRRTPVEVDIDGDGSRWVPLAERDAERVVRHLLDNAARHARSLVRVALRSTDTGEVLLLVDDDGAGIPVADRARVLERFGRLDEARSRDAGGAGLGLSVAAEVAAAAGGRLTVEESPLGGARIRVTLPAR